MRLLLLAHAPVVHTQVWARALAARGHEIRLLTLDEAPGAPHPGRAVGIRVPVTALRVASAVGEVRRELRDFRPDATVAHFLPDYGFLAALAGARPLFLVCWGSDLLLNATRSPFHRARARFTLSRADAVHVDAAVLADAAIRLGAPKDRVWNRAWGVDVDALKPNEPWAARRARSGGRGIRILWTRRLHPLYRPETFLDALARLRAKGVPFSATIVGDGPLRPALEARARAHGVAAAVRFTGWVGDAEIRAHLAAHDVYVSLSSSDSTSQSLLEAMAAGLIPVVSDIEGNREWVRHRQEGYLVPGGDPEAVACAIAEIAGSGATTNGPAGRDSLADPGAMAARAQAKVAAKARFSDTVGETETRLAALAGRVA